MAESNEKIPAYLLWYLFRIRKHGYEPGYFDARFRSMNIKKAHIEAQMLEELYIRGLITLPTEPNRRKTFADSEKPGHDGAQTLSYWDSFTLTPAGKYVIVTAIQNGIGETVKTLVTAIIGAAAVIIVGS